MQQLKNDRISLPLLPQIRVQQQVQSIDNLQTVYVYPPGDDSYMFLRALYGQLQIFPTHPTVLQIGSGSGIISANLATWLKNNNNQCTLHISIDVNPDASITSQHYYWQYAPEIVQINTSIIKNTTISTIAPDVVIFNPPYIPIPQQQQQYQRQFITAKFKSLREQTNIQRKRQHNIIAYSYMGGPDGLSVTRQFLNAITWPCITYFIVMGKQGLIIITKQIPTIIQPKRLKSQLQIISNQQFHNEDLYLIKLILTKQHL